MSALPSSSMVIKRDIVVTTRADGAFVALLDTAVACGCGRAAMMVVNRHGSTTCLDCDAKRDAPR